MQTNKRCLIISGGEYCRFDSSGFDMIIACDRGFRYAEKQGVRPDCVIGDFDSTDEPDTDIPKLKYSCDKDDTDTMLAAKHALAQGFRDIEIVCALGGRFDHAFANIQTAALIASEGGIARITDSSTVITVFSGGSVSFPRRDGWSLSCFSLSDVSEDVSVLGSKFETTGLSLTNATSIGMSDTWKDELITVSVKKGTIMVVESLLRKGEHI